jgi:hypothetical protein
MFIIASEMSTLNAVLAALELSVASCPFRQEAGVFHDQSRWASKNVFEPND